ncbi:MAG: Methyltransferase type 11 [Mucilaginibacter sp.]|nr:Methyltransferase type 11 [Mucilaginibacter sp.]
MVTKLIKNIPLLHTLGLFIKHWRWGIRTKKSFVKYLNSHDVFKLQLGAGLNALHGWFNTDYFARPAIFFLNVTKKFPFPDNTFELIFSEHHIEHITYQEAQIMLAEAYRVMKPGGYIKITTPDLQKYIQSYAARNFQLPLIKEHATDWIYSGFAYASSYIPISDNFEAHFINDIFLNYEHRFIYDFNALKILMEKAGFININDPANEYADFQGIETHDSDFDRMFTLYLHAEKPLA